MPRGNLVHRHADACLYVALARVHAVEPRLLNDAVRARALTALVAQTADHGHVLAHRFERLEDERKLEVPADFRGLPLVLQRAVREVDEPQTRVRSGDRLRQRGSCRDHGIQQWESYRGASALEDGAP